uniref:Uncharacterized protein n=1 Tax=Timema monikensis TaxID=170555 RepID=A0A7R9EHR0_9NEOP|nr:unnamed protein product [Timema monikensis]
MVWTRNENEREEASKKINGYEVCMEENARERSAAVSACAYAVYRYWKRRESKSIDEGFEDVSREISSRISVAKVGEIVNSDRCGNLRLLTSNGIGVTMHKVLACDSLSHNLLSVKRLEENNLKGPDVKLALSCNDLSPGDAPCKGCHV